MPTDTDWRIDPATRATAASPDGRVLMHLVSGRVSAVNGMGSDIWGHLEAGRSVTAIVSALAADYDAPPQRIADDVAAFLRDLEAKGFAHARGRNGRRGFRRRGRWVSRHGAFAGEPAGAAEVASVQTLVQTPAPAQGRAQALDGRVSPVTADCTPLDTMEAFAAFLAVDVAIAVGGFHRLHRRLRGAPVRGVAPSDVHATVARVNTAVDRAAIWYPRQALCLPRSAAATWMLRRRGVPAVFVIGVRKLPFYAHAWVEVGGRVVNDAPSVAEKYPAIERC